MHDSNFGPVVLRCEHLSAPSPARSHVDRVCALMIADWLATSSCAAVCCCWASAPNDVHPCAGAQVDLE